MAYAIYMALKFGNFKERGLHLLRVEQMEEKDKNIINELIDAFITKKKIQQIAGDISKMPSDDCFFILCTVDTLVRDLKAIKDLCFER